MREEGESADGSEWVPAAPNRSGAVLLTIGLVVSVETVALHLWLHPHHAYLGWTFTGLSLLTLAWLVRDYRALALAGISLDPQGCRIRIGRRVRADIAWTAVEGIRLPSWRDLPAPSRDYLNAARPDDPNVLLTFQAPLAVTGVIGRRTVRQLGLRLVPAERVIKAWEAWRDRIASVTVGAPAPGEGDLMTLLRDMRPELDERPYAFVSVPPALVEAEKPACLGLFHEAEGVTLILEAGEAERLGVPTTVHWARITLAVHSSLSAVGFMARLGAALAAAGISANPVAGYYHDHLFVPWRERRRALAVLQGLAAAASAD